MSNMNRSAVHTAPVTGLDEPAILYPVAKHVAKNLFEATLADVLGMLEWPNLQSERKGVWPRYSCIRDSLWI